jgi:hypothetical protein
MASVTVGTALFYGLDGSVANLLVQSYSLSATFNADITAQDSTGITVTHRLDDRKTELTIEGIAETDEIPKLGDTLQFTVNTKSAYSFGDPPTVSYEGTVTKVDDKGTNKGWTMVSVTCVAYEGA